MDRMDDVVEYTLKIMLFLYDIRIIEYAEEKGNWMLQTVTKKKIKEMVTIPTVTYAQIFKQSEG